MRFIKTRNGTCFSTQTYLGEVWYQGLAEGEYPVYVKVVDVTENSGDIFTQPCTESGDLIEVGSPDAQGAYAPFWGVYNINHIYERINMLGIHLPINFIYCPVLNYSCFNNSPIVGMTCESNMLTLSVEYEWQNVLTFYPNPGQNELNILGLESCKQVLICNVSGEVVADYSDLNSENGRIDVSNLLSGAYWIVIVADSGVFVHSWVKWIDMVLYFFTLSPIV